MRGLRAAVHHQCAPGNKLDAGWVRSGMPHRFSCSSRPQLTCGWYSNPVEERTPSGGIPDIADSKVVFQLYGRPAPAMITPNDFISHCRLAWSTISGKLCYEAACQPIPPTTAIVSRHGVI
jgi:hypothetical protein